MFGSPILPFPTAPTIPTALVAPQVSLAVRALPSPSRTQWEGPTTQRRSPPRKPPTAPDPIPNPPLENPHGSLYDHASATVSRSPHICPFFSISHTSPHTRTHPNTPRQILNITPPPSPPGRGVHEEDDDTETAIGRVNRHGVLLAPVSGATYVALHNARRRLHGVPTQRPSPVPRREGQGPRK